MLNKMTLKSKLLIPIFGLITVIMLLGTLIVMFSYDKIITLSDLNKNVILSNYISDTISSMQRERGLSSGYVTDKLVFQKKLILQRESTDKSIEVLFEYLNVLHSDKASLDYLNVGYSDNAIELNNQEVRNSFKKLDSIRKNIDKNTLNYTDIMTEYSKIINLLLKNIVDIAKESHLPKITQNLTAYVDFLYFKESIGLQRALGVKILSLDEISSANRIKMAKLVSMREQYFLMFTNYASKDILSHYNKIAKLKLFKMLRDIEKSIIYQNSLDEGVSPRYWYELKTQELTLLSGVSKYTKIKTLDYITQELKYSKIVFVSISFLILLSIGIFSLMLIAILRLTKEEHKLRMVLDKYIVSSITDLKGKIIDASEAFCNISGYSKKELVGRNHNIVRHPSMDKKVFEEIWRTIKKGDSWKGKVKNRKKDGSFYWVYSNIEPLCDVKGNINSYISVRLDITESELLIEKVKEEEAKNKIQEELMQHQHRLAQMGEMLSMIAHQWRQPLSAINATAGVIKVKVRLNKLDSQTALMLSEKIEGFSNHLSSTIDDFRDFFKPNKVKSETNFKKILDSVLQISESSLEKNGIILTQNIKSIENFVTYENELKQVLLNLIKNAEDAIVEKSIKNPEITVEIDENILIVSDNAGGISEDIISEIFNPYFSTKTKKDGTGLGLYMSKIIVEDHCGGKLSVQNTQVGASFKIILGRDYD